eukprot:CAMPEP_0174255794 /NCGR_PEP_ID=MMETSP0439-20130205/5094_1 /TAXON_ID=0 /ORGANISM="Stereomyxa ramosa, Strain Chinc5" /LENGTH=621 /DNA_ID=CAMNT_0015338133 /DNA_START=44 /DNA_END=1909 /DNA_ORIENTATION=-
MECPYLLQAQEFTALAIAEDNNNCPDQAATLYESAIIFISKFLNSSDNERAKCEASKTLKDVSCRYFELSALANAREACGLDADKQFPEALVHYKKAVNFFLKLSKLNTERSRHVSSYLLPKITQYMNRAEELRVIVGEGMSTNTEANTQYRSAVSISPETIVKVSQIPSLDSENNNSNNRDAMTVDPEQTQQQKTRHRLGRIRKRGRSNAQYTLPIQVITTVLEKISQEKLKYKKSKRLSSKIANYDNIWLQQLAGESDLANREILILGHLSAILGNENHKLGKMAIKFSRDFAAMYQNTEEISECEFTETTEVIKAKINSITLSIIQSFPSIKTDHNSIQMSTQFVILTLVFPSYFPMYKIRYRKEDEMYRTKFEELKQLENVHTFDTPKKFHSLVEAHINSRKKGIPGPLEQSILGLSEIPNHKTCISKIHSITAAVNNVVKCVGSFYPGVKIEIGGDDLITLMCHIILAADIPYAYSELMFMQDWSVQHLLLGKDGYCLATFETVFLYLLEHNESPNLPNTEDQKVKLSPPEQADGDKSVMPLIINDDEIMSLLSKANHYFETRLHNQHSPHSLGDSWTPEETEKELETVEKDVNDLTNEMNYTNEIVMSTIGGDNF